MTSGSSGSGGGKVPKKQPKRGRLWLTDGSCVRLREHRKSRVVLRLRRTPHNDGRKYRMLNVLEENKHESLAIRIARKLRAIVTAGWEVFPSAHRSCG